MSYAHPTYIAGHGSKEGKGSFRLVGYTTSQHNHELAYKQCVL